MILHDVEVESRRVDVRVHDGRVADVAPRLSAERGEDVVDGRGSALLPGLHDHHIHLYALAARNGSAWCGEPAVVDRASFAARLREAARDVPRGTWIRAVGYDDERVGRIDRVDLDAIAPDHPVRVQHRSGALWVLNTKALEAVGVASDDGRLFGQDADLRRRWATTGPPPDLRSVGDRLARCGVTGVSDATAGNGPAEADDLERAAIPQRVMVMGGADLVGGIRKLVVADHDDPDPGALQEAIVTAHGAGRTVAIHAATRAALVVALMALEAAGPRDGDRIEHASVAPPDLVDWLGRLGVVTVVTQPNFVFEHGDRYRRGVDADDLPWLYRVRGFLDAGVRLAGGTDAPFGDPDPWIAVRAAVERRTAGGAALGEGEAISPEAALGLFLGRPDDPGGDPRRIEVGAAADLCLLRAPWSEARTVLHADLVAGTWVGGRMVFSGGVRG